MNGDLGPVQRKIILLLGGGLALGLSGSPRRYFRITKMIGREWREIKRDSLRRAIRRLYESKLIHEKVNPDGSVTLTLSEKGRMYPDKSRKLTLNMDNMKIAKPEKWDRKWRIVLFDIPKEKKDLRDTLRRHLIQLGFHRFQKSVFIHPFPCKNEVEFLIEFYNARSYVRQITADWLDNELHLKAVFRLP